MTRRALLSDRSGAGALEFALVLPLMLILLFAVIDGGRWIWSYNRAAKAAQVGARVAAVTKIIPTGLVGSYVDATVGGTTLTQGDLIPTAAIGTVTCNAPSGTLACTCTGTTPPTGGSCPGTLSTIGWDAIRTRVKQFDPAINDNNISVEYRGSGLGYAGDPSGLNTSPLVTVRITGLQFQPITFLALTSIQAFPVTTSTFTAEDELGNQSN